MYKGKIGFVSISHQDYVNDLVHMQTASAASNITECGYQIVEIKEQVTDYKTALEAGKYLASQLVDGVIIFLASWVECPTVMAVVREIEHIPFCLQSFPMFLHENRQESTGAYVAFAMFKGTLDRIGYRHMEILAPVGSDEAKMLVNDFCCAACAVMQLKRSRIGLIGYTSMSIYPGTFDHVLMRVKIGPEIEQLDSYTLINSAETFSDELKEGVINEYRRKAEIHSEVTSQYLLKSAGIYLALEKIINDRGFDAINMKCQYEFSKEYKMVPCVPLSLIADTGVVASCEGDMLNTVSMVILHYLTDSTVTYGDVMNHYGNTVKLSTCGFLPFSMGAPKTQMIKNFMPHPGFTGIQCSFTIKPERVTVMRLVEDQFDYHILYFTGQGIDTDLRQGYMPALDVILDGDINRLVTNFSGQHFAICFGDISEKIEALAKILKIKTIRV